MLKEIDLSNVYLDMSNKEQTKIEMCENDIKFLIYQLRKYQPKNILEIGTSAGGSAYYLLKETKDATVTSVDLATEWYRDKQYPTGFVVDNLLGEERDNNYLKRWHKYFGYDAIDLMNNPEKKQFDFVLIDTVHVLPGEFLSFLAILPFVEDNSPIIFHDTRLHYHHMMWKKGNKYDLSCYATTLLTSVISSNYKEFPSEFCNIGMIVKTNETVENVLDVIRALQIPWYYMPPDDILDKYYSFIHRNYGELCERYFRETVLMNKNYMEMEKIKKGKIRELLGL